MNMVDTRYISYPVWVYSFDLDFPGKDSENLDYWQLTYDARTGERTW